MVRKWFDYGRSRGAAEGKAEGEAKGWSAILSQLLSMRFGPLPTVVQEQLSHASESDCERWTERLLSASSLDDVLAA
jgi:hypothetical protein